MSTNRSRAILVCLLANLVFQRAPLAAQESAPLEYQVKAAFLLNFTKFIDWPASELTDPNTPFGICILGEDPFGGVLDQMVEGERIQRRRLVVQRVRRPPPASCQVLYIGKAEKEVEGVLAGLGSGVLSVSDQPGFLREGGMISFVVENHRVRFDINQAAAARAGLTISSKLLNVARLVEK